MAKRKAPEPAATESTKRVRRMKILSTNTVNSGQQTLYTQNATSSPLLRLPPEIRNRIWLLALCGKSIHILADVRRKGSPLCRAICQATIQDEAAFAQLQAENAQEGPVQWTDRYSTRHNDCTPFEREEERTGDYEVLPLSLLQACRQIHQEAGLLPYQHNNFVFNNPWDIAPFLRKLVPAQARVIETITLGCRHGYGNKTFRQLCSRKLKSLAHITCFIEVAPHTYGYVFPRLELNESVMQLKQKPFQSASVVVSAVAWYLQPRGEPAATKEYLRTWAAELEGQLMSSED